MKVIIHRHNLQQVVKRNKEGFGRFTPGKPGTTEPWLQLESIGISSKGLNDNFIGKIQINIQRGGILNINDIGKLPIILNKEQIESDPKFSGLSDADKKRRNEKAIKEAASFRSRLHNMFKTEVLPAIRNFVPSCGDSFILCLHYSNRLLSSVEMEYKTPIK